MSKVSQGFPDSMSDVCDWNPVPGDDFKREQFKELSVATPFEGDTKILVLDPPKFETPIPMHHFDNVGFKFDIATQDSAPLALEEWAFPMDVGHEDRIRQMREKVKDQVENLRKDNEIAETLDGYAALFIPGGHGPIFDIHNRESPGKLHQSANAEGMRTISLNHGCPALHAAAVGADFSNKNCIIVVLPDSMDKICPKFGYLPCYLSKDNLVEGKLRALGCQVQNMCMTMHRKSLSCQHSCTELALLHFQCSQCSFQHIPEFPVPTVTSH